MTRDFLLVKVAESLEIRCYRLHLSDRAYNRVKSLPDQRVIRQLRRLVRVRVHACIYARDRARVSTRAGRSTIRQEIFRTITNISDNSLRILLILQDHRVIVSRIGHSP